jgi:glycine hydroxymethyltransferase
MLQRAGGFILRRRVPKAVQSSRRCITDETRGWAKALNEPLVNSDPDLYKIIEQEKVRQRESLVLIASENFTSK